MDNIINIIAGKNQDNAKEGDYINSDGILICGKCGQPKECIKEFPPGSGRMKKFSVICRCDVEEEKAFRTRLERQEWKEYVKQLYKQGLTDSAYLKNTFENDDNRNPGITALCKKYVAHWEEHKSNCHGILFYGDTGGGKSYYSCCIANALLQNGVKVLVSRLSDLVKNRINKDSQEINLKIFDLIVVDDIGTENSTQTAYNIIDDIYRYNIPLIVTTNLAPSELKNPDTIDKQRIYDRVLERCCITQKVDVKISRLDTARKRREQALKILNTQ